MPPNSTLNDSMQLPQVGDVIGDKYSVEGVLGKGGMAVVLRARHLQTGKTVAVKWMLPAVLHREAGAERFLRESQVAGLINHPNVVDIYDVGAEGRGYYLVMEYLRGRPLDDVLDAGGATIDELLGYVTDAARGVHAAHGRGVLHRDLKPENIFICDSPDGYSKPYAKVLDFGISKLMEGADAGVSRLTLTGTMLGTPYYMSPEQAQGGQELDLRSDVYAMGTVIFECCTGDIPFDGSTYNELIVKIATRPAPAPSSLNPALPEAIDEFVSHAMAHNRRHRYRDMAELLAALAEMRAGLSEEVKAMVPIAPDQSARATQQGAGPDFKSGVTERKDSHPPPSEDPQGNDPQGSDVQGKSPSQQPSSPPAQAPGASKQPSAVATLEFDLRAGGSPGGTGDAGPDSAARGERHRAMGLAQTQHSGAPAVQRRPSGPIALLAVLGLLGLGAVAWFALAPADAPDTTADTTVVPKTADTASTTANTAGPADKAQAVQVAEQEQSAPTPAPTPPVDAHPTAAVAPKDGIAQAPPAALPTDTPAPAPIPSQADSKDAPRRRATKASARPRTPQGKPPAAAAQTATGVEAKGLSGTLRSDDFL